MSELTTVCLCRVDLNSRYEHSIHFDSFNEQSNFFYDRMVKFSSNYTEIRRTWELQVQFPYSEIKECNYLYFSQDGKVWYYFINSMEYKNEGSTVLSLELDVIQTYMFDWDIPPCFVERQHTETDNLYEHTIDEGLECGELINAGERVFMDGQEHCLLVFSTIDIINTTGDTTYYSMRSVLDSCYSGANVYAIEPAYFTEFSERLELLSTWGKIDGIISMHMYPKDLIKLASGYAWGDANIIKKVIGGNYFEEKLPTYITNRTYTPKNNKLYCYPYNFMYISNNNGNGGVFRFERFNDPNNITFKVIGGVTMDSGCKAIPYAYNNVVNQYNDEAGILLSGFPSCSWNSDTYKIWLAQNQNQHALTVYDANIKKGVSAISGLAGIAGGLATGNLGAAVGSAGAGLMGAYQSSMQIKSLVAQQNDMSITPPQSKGSSSPSLNLAYGYQNFSVIYKRVTDENAKIIDDYFTMYGYKINRLREPNTNARQKFTYVKTVGCLVRGDFNQLDKQKIQSIFDNGITFWRDGLNIGSYGDNPCW